MNIFSIKSDIVDLENVSMSECLKITLNEIIDKQNQEFLMKIGCTFPDDGSIVIDIDFNHANMIIIKLCNRIRVHLREQKIDSLI